MRAELILSGDGMAHKIDGINCPKCGAQTTNVPRGDTFSFQCKNCRDLFRVIVNSWDDLNPNHPAQNSSICRRNESMRRDSASVDAFQASPAVGESVGAGSHLKPKEYTCAVIITEDNLKAYIQLSGPDEASVTADEIKQVLTRNKIEYGVIDYRVIQGILKYDSVRKKPFMVAEGRAPKPGRDASVKYFFELECPKTGHIKQNGRVDFRDKGKIPHVREGDLLAEKTSLVPGESGMDVFKRLIPAVKCRDIRLRSVKGARLSSDKQKVYAGKEGRPVLTFGGKLSVVSEITISGDVCLKTGHIDYPGNVIVSGAVCEGFRVRGHDVRAKEIFGAQVDTSGSVRVSGGIVGAEIRCRCNVTAKFIRDSRICAYGNVFVEKEIIDSEVLAGGSCHVAKGKIISSDVSARQSIKAVDIGTEVSNPCGLRVGIADYIRKDIRRISDSIATGKAKLDKMCDWESKLGKGRLQVADKIDQITLFLNMPGEGFYQPVEKIPANAGSRNLKGINQILGLSGENGRDSGSTSTLFRLIRQKDQLDGTLKRIREEKKQLQDTIEELEDEKKDIILWDNGQKSSPVVRVDGTLYAGTRIVGPHSKLRITDSLQKGVVKEVKKNSPESGGLWEMIVASLKTKTNSAD